MPLSFSIHFAAAAEIPYMTQNNSSKIFFCHLAQSATQSGASSGMSYSVTNAFIVLYRLKKIKRPTHFNHECYIMPPNTLSKIEFPHKNKTLSYHEPFPAPKMSACSVLAYMSSIFMNLSHFSDGT